MKLLTDSDFLIANAKKDDPSHKTATSISRKLQKEKTELYCLNLVVQESATVISKRIGMDSARIFYKNIDSIIDKFIILDEELEKLSWEIFLVQRRKGTSFIDCANIAAIKKYKLDGILSFDDFYPKDLRIK
ncbi:hypothetical protein A2Z22_03455 [Candidatus Woesebacteria bacterium RBG_16_34_12]|uniref:Uncharacterized protein n=1 Tax=Candidatus Woesebacteria bacterium RBG_16_34_12 TaxID=1802480 RepID=A0A1F7XAS0_9BACT|nr:MAG: hypothetical protein A2Z22_03455 [Candidatus Woesebacteria bacterium RBG_16_34_12]